MSKKTLAIAAFVLLGSIAVIVALASGGNTPDNQSAAISETINK